MDCGRWWAREYYKRGACEGWRGQRKSRCEVLVVAAEEREEEQVGERESTWESHGGGGRTGSMWRGGGGLHGMYRVSCTFPTPDLACGSVQWTRPATKAGKSIKKGEGEGRRRNRGGRGACHVRRHDVLPGGGGPCHGCGAHSMWGVDVRPYAGSWVLGLNKCGAKFSRSIGYRIRIR